MRLAAGDTAAEAATNTTAATDAEVISWLSTHALGTIPGGTATLDNGIYVPTDGSGNPRGGIYVQGDARIRLNVVQGAGDFDANYWANINPGDRGCKFQKLTSIV